MSFSASLPLFRATSRASHAPKRLQTGLFDGRTRMSGNAIGETFNSKTRRNWQPNVQTKALFSEILGRNLKLKVTVGALRTIDKVGGLDSYLFRMRPERLGDKGMRLRELVQEAQAQSKRERQALAVPSDLTQDVLPRE